MPNASQRITDTTIRGMNSMLFMFSCLDERVDITNLPKFHVVINNVSRFADHLDLDAIEKNPDSAAIDTESSLSVEKRIEDIKFQLKDGAKTFYLSEEISDCTRIG